MNILDERDQPTLNSPVGSRRYILFFFLLAIPLSLVTIPAIFAEIHAPRDMQWTGIQTRNTADTNVYLSLIEQIRQNGLLARNLHTPELHPPFQLRPTYILIGLVGRLIPWRNVLLIEAARFFSSLLLLVSILFIAFRLFDKPKDRILAFFFIALGSGLDWLQPSNPAALVGPESSTVATLTAPPHFAMSLLVLIAVIDLISKIIHTGGDLRTAVLASAGCLFLGFEHPFDLLPLVLATACTFFWFLNKKRNLHYRELLPLIPVVVAVAAAIATQLLLIRHVAVFDQWNKQNFCPSPAILPHILCLGVAPLLAFAGARSLYEKAPVLTIMLASYALFALVCSRLPFSAQWRFMEGAPLCLAIIAANGIIQLRRWLSEHRRSPVLVTVLVFGLALPATFQLVSQDIASVLPGLPPQYMPAKLLEGMAAVRNFAAPEEPVFSTEFTGNFIPAYAGRPVFIGHRVQTARFAERRSYLLKLFQDADPAKRRRSVVKTGARWLFWGPSEKQLWGIDPDREPYLRRVYSNGVCSLYRIE